MLRKKRRDLDKPLVEYLDSPLIAYHFPGKYKGYETIAQKRVFKPLGMPSTSYVWPARYEGNFAYGHNGSGQPYPIARRHSPGAAGSMSTTLADFTKFYTALITNKPLTPESFKDFSF